MASCLSDEELRRARELRGKNREERQATVQRLRDKGGFAVSSEPILNRLLPPNEAMDAVVALLSEDKRRPQKIRKIVLEPVIDLQCAGRRVGADAAAPRPIRPLIMRPSMRSGRATG